VQRRSVIAAGLAAPLFIARPLRAQAMPRNITIICPFAPGGPTDLISRLMAESMGPFLEAQMVVENVTGAGGTIGAARVANARPDGAVLLMHHIGHAGAASLYRRLPYNVEESFATIGLVTEVPQMIVARPDFPANTVAELLAALRAGGERISIGNSGLGSSDHLAGMLLQREAGTTLNTIGFRGSAPIATELMASRLDVYGGQGTILAPLAREGRIKAFAVTSETRLPGPVLDAVPTVIEAGHRDLLMSVWHGMYAPRATPDELVERISLALRQAIQQPRVVARFAELVTEPVPQARATPAYHKQFLASEVARWRPMIQSAGAFAD
jgi:tripartite-type tricarboxylate transporter receptor subunit TctC